MISVKSDMDKVLISLGKDYAGKIGGKDVDKLVNTVAANLLATIRKRVFKDGQDADGGAILDGKYSTEPMYINPNKGLKKKSRGITPKGKDGEKTFKNGNPHKTVYLSEGYKEWRRLNGSITNKVNLNFSGDLDRSFTYKKIDNGKYGIGFTDQLNYDKAEGNTERNVIPIFNVGKLEEEVITKTIKEFIDGKDSRNS